MKLCLRPLAIPPLPLAAGWLKQEHVKSWFTHPQSWLDEMNGARERLIGFGISLFLRTVSMLAFVNITLSGKAARTGMGTSLHKARTALII